MLPALHHAVAPLLAAGGTLVLLGQRIVAGDGATTACSLAGAGAVGMALAVALWRAHSIDRALRRAATLPTVAGLLATILGLAAYAVGRGSAPPLSWGARGAGLCGVLAAWLWGAGGMVVLACERALWLTRAAPVGAPARLRAALASAGILIACGTSFAGLNVAAATWARKVDVSHARTSAAGGATRAAISSLAAPLTISTFFPPGNPVAEQVESYLAALAPLSRQLRIERLDQATAVERARQLRVRSNGQLVVWRGEVSQLIHLGLDVEEARHGLRRLDAAIFERVSRVARPERIVYLTEGHNEREPTPAPDDRRAGLGDLQGLLRGLGLTVRRLGLGDGLGTAVPRDAQAVVLVGATAPLTDGERLSLAGYLRAGGRALIAMDPDHAPPDHALLGALGVDVTEALVTHDTARVQVEGRGPSPHDILTNALSPHPIVRGLERGRGRAAVVLLGSGAVVRAAAPDTTPPPEVSFPLHAMPGSRLTPAASVGPLELAAAIRWPGAVEGRAVVLGDADLLSDALLRNVGNAALVLEAARWLIGEDAAGPAASSEEDVLIVRRRDQDAIWFWAVVVAVPALVLGLGLALQRRRHRPPGRR